MTIPIARVVATRYANADAAPALLLLRPRLPLRAAAARAGARDAAGGARAGRRARAGGHRGGAHRAVPRRSTPPACANYRIGARRRVAVPGAARSRRRAGEARGRRSCTSWSRATSSASSARCARCTGTTSCCACRSCAAASTCSTRRRRPAVGCARVYDLLAPAVAERVIFDLGLIALARLLHGRGVRGLRRRARRPDRRRRALRRAARPLRPRPARVRLGARTSSGCTSRASGRAASGLEDLRVAVPRGALFGDTLDLLDRARRRHRRGARQRPQAAVRGRRDRHDAARPTCRPTSRRAPPTSGSPARTCSRAVRARGVRAARPRLRRRAGWCSRPSAGDDPAAEALRRLGVMRIATKYPQIAARYFERTGRQAEIVEVKGSVELAPLTGLVEGIVDLTATGTTLRENGLVIREEIVRLDRAADRQPGRVQAQGGGDRRAAGAHPCALSARSRTPRRSLRACVRWCRARVGRRRGGGDRRATCATAAMATLLEYETRFGGTGRAGRADGGARGRARRARPGRARGR